MFDMVAIGGETNGPTVTFTPEWDWVENILWQARQSGTKVYFKENLLCRPKEMPRPKDMSLYVPLFPEPEADDDDEF